MNNILKETISIIEKYKNAPDFLDALFDKDKEDALQGRPVLICCAGCLGQRMLSVLKNSGIQPVAICENDSGKIGTRHIDTPIISFADAFRKYPDALFVIAVKKHQAAILSQLMVIGVSPQAIKCSDEKSLLLYEYIGIGTHAYLSSCLTRCAPQTYLDYLKSRQESIAKAYDILGDNRSRELLITKLALTASQGQFSLFAHYISTFSEPYRDFGPMGYDGTPEDYYYFNNDIFCIRDNEIYIDVGAFDGDTIETFLDACTRNSKSFEKIIAFEPDPDCFRKLAEKYSNEEKIALKQLGLWSKTTQLRFASSTAAPSKGYTEQGAAISQNGDIIIDVTSLDDFLGGQKVTLLKMDPPGNIVPKVLHGAASTIKRHRPNLAAGAYHGPDSIFEIPLLVHDICPDYRIVLRQNTCHLCDTDLLATVQEAPPQKKPLTDILIIT